MMPEFETFCLIRDGRPYHCPTKSAAPPIQGCFSLLPTSPRHRSSKTRHSRPHHHSRLKDYKSVVANYSFSQLSIFLRNQIAATQAPYLHIFSETLRRSPTPTPPSQPLSQVYPPKPEFMSIENLKTYGMSLRDHHHVVFSPLLGASWPYLKSRALFHGCFAVDANAMAFRSLRRSRRGHRTDEKSPGFDPYTHSTYVYSTCCLDTLPSPMAGAVRDNKWRLLNLSIIR